MPITTVNQPTDRMKSLSKSDDKKNNKKKVWDMSHDVV